MELYQIERKILASDVDLHRRLRPTALFTLLQEASIAHTEALGAGREKTLDRGLLWVLTLQNVTLRTVPEYDDRITLQSWPGPMMHLLFPRYYRILDAAGNTAVQAAALWVLVDAETRKTVSPQEAGVFVPGMVLGTEPPFPRAPRSLPVVRETCCTVPYSAADLNGHMNNARYPELAMDLLPPEVLARPLASAEIEYGGEARLGSAFTVAWGREDPSCYFEGTDGDGRRIFRLRMTFQKEENAL